LAILGSERVAWTYTADDGKTYRVAALEAFTAQTKLGGGAWNGTDPPKPENIKMRRITVSAAGLGSRVVPMYTVGAPIATAGATLNVNVLQVEQVLISSGNPIPQGHLRQSVTKVVS
jgi:hypothetical protein